LAINLLRTYNYTWNFSVTDHVCKPENIANNVGKSENVNELVHEGNWIYCNGNHDKIKKLQKVFCNGLMDQI